MKAIYFLVPFLILASILYFTGFYPVAFVNSSPIMYSTWRKSFEAARRFTLAEAASRNQTIDFSKQENAELVLEVEKGSLTFLMEDSILRQSGERLIEDFERLSLNRMQEAVAIGGDLKTAARTIYGLSFADFKILVLLPQARRDAAKELLQESQRDFAEWFAGEKKKAKVKLLFVPFTWNGEAVQ